MIKELSVGSATVLILEDEPIARLHLAQLLRRRTDLHIEALGSGEKAVAFAEQSKIDVLLADIVMEGIDGIEAAARIQARQDTVVIFVTASTDPKTRERAQKLKPYAIMTKPTEIEELIALVDGALSARQSPEEAYLQPDFLLDTLYDTAAIGMCVTDTEGRFVRVNRAYCNTYGYSREEILGEPFTMVLPEEDREFAARMHDDFISGAVTEIPGDWRVRKKSGEIRNIFVTAGRMIGTDGRPYKITTVADVTERKRHEEHLTSTLEEKEMLLKEVHHRVKNNLNTLSSLLNLQLEQYRDEERITSILSTSVNRIKTMSSIYERLHQSGAATKIDLAEYLTALAEDLIETSTISSSVSLESDLASASVDIDTAISAGLIVNELVTNCLKHAFSGVEEAVVYLASRVEDGRYLIDIRDTGKGIPADFDSRVSNSLGFQLMHAVVGQKRGGVEILDRERAHVQVTLPL